MLGACVTLGATALALPPAASAKPTVTLTTVAAPIPQSLLDPHGRAWPHTGDSTGEPAELEAHFTIAGAEYGGFPSPLRRVVLYLPKGTAIHTGGFGRCRHPAAVPRHGVPCLSGSLASVPGQEVGLLSFGGTPAYSHWEQGAFLPVGGTLAFWSHTIGNGSFDQGGYNTGSLTPTTGAYSYKLTENLPLRLTGLGESAMSTTSTDVTLGAIHKQGSELVSLVTTPRSCPAGGWPVMAELSFGAGTEETWETVTASTQMPCVGRGAKDAQFQAGRVSRAHDASTTPKTVAQCKGKFKRGSTARTRCIKRVEAEKPGTSCAHPLFSGFAVDGAVSQKSDTKDFTVKYKRDSEIQSRETGGGNSITFQAEVGTSALQRMLRNPYYAGLIVYKRGTKDEQIFEGRHDALTDRETFDRVQMLLSEKRVAGERPQVQRHYLRGSVFCGDCGQRLTFGVSTARTVVSIPTSSVAPGSTVRAARSEPICAPS